MAVDVHQEVSRGEVPMHQASGGAIVPTHLVGGVEPGQPVEEDAHAEGSPQGSRAASGLAVVPEDTQGDPRDQVEHQEDLTRRRPASVEHGDDVQVVAAGGEAALPEKDGFRHREPGAVVAGWGVGQMGM
jgi:hypothetical protein